jgi:hypothetical protein
MARTFQMHCVLLVFSGVLLVGACGRPNDHAQVRRLGSNQRSFSRLPESTPPVTRPRVEGRQTVLDLPEQFGLLHFGRHAHPDYPRRQPHICGHAIRMIMEVQKIAAMQMKHQRSDLLERGMSPKHI